MPGEFNTERLRARPLTKGDLDLLIELNADPEVMRHLTGRAMTADETSAEVDAARGSRWLLFRSSDERFVGWVGALPIAATGEYELGWRLHRFAWGNGFASEAAGALVDRLFAEGASRVLACTMAVNHRSRSVMDRIGLVYVRTFHLTFDDPLPGTEQGEVEYARTRTEWQRQARP